MNYRTSIKQFLSNLKAPDVKVVPSVADAKRLMISAKIGLFIVEWGLDEVNGLQFCRELRSNPQYKNTPFLLLSVENLKQDIILASEVDIDGYLLKPFSYEDFCSQLLMIQRSYAKPNRINTLLDIADEKLSRADLMGAEINFRKVLEIKPESARALVGIARVVLARGDGEAAKSVLRDAIDGNPHYIEAYRMRLEIAVTENDRASIIETAMFLHSLSPDNPRYTLMLAKAHMDMEEIEGSEKYFRKTISLSPRLAEAYRGLGNVYMLQEEYDLAMKNFNKALDLDSTDISTLNSFGMAYIRLGDFEKGIQKYMLALKLDPHDQRVLFNIGYAYEKSGELIKAKWYYNQSLLQDEAYTKAARGLDRITSALAGKAS